MSFLSVFPLSDFKFTQHFVFPFSFLISVFLASDFKTSTSLFARLTANFKSVLSALTGLEIFSHCSSVFSFITAYFGVFPS